MTMTTTTTIPLWKRQQQLDEIVREAKKMELMMFGANKMRKARKAEKENGRRGRSGDDDDDSEDDDDGYAAVL
jgi:hypothetical protein